MRETCKGNEKLSHPLLFHFISLDDPKAVWPFILTFSYWTERNKQKWTRTTRVKPKLQNHSRKAAKDNNIQKLDLRNSIIENVQIFQSIPKMPSINEWGKRNQGNIWSQQPFRNNSFCTKLHLWWIVTMTKITKWIHKALEISKFEFCLLKCRVIQSKSWQYSKVNSWREMTFEPVICSCHLLLLLWPTF